MNFIKGIFPVYINYTDDGIPEGIAGVANRFKILIRPKYIKDKGVLAHEEQHVWQWYRTFMFHSLLYKFSKSYRFFAEVDAYAIQLKVNQENNFPDYLDFYALRMTQIYDLNITQEEAKFRLEQKLNKIGG